MTLRNGNNAAMLAILAAMGGGCGQPPIGEPRKRYVPKPIDHEAECRKFDGKVMRHRYTGEDRKVVCFADGVVFGRSARGKPWRKALDWIRNADVVGGA